MLSLRSLCAPTLCLIGGEQRTADNGSMANGEDIFILNYFGKSCIDAVCHSASGPLRINTPAINTRNTNAGDTNAIYAKISALKSQTDCFVGEHANNVLIYDCHRNGVYYGGDMAGRCRFARFLTRG